MWSTTMITTSVFSDGHGTLTQTYFWSQAHDRGRVADPSARSTEREEDLGCWEHGAVEEVST